MGYPLPMKVLLTGAAGFIGTHVLAALRSEGHEVVALDLMLPSAHGESALPPDGVLAVDVRDAESLAVLLRGVDVVCHQAAVVGAGIDAADGPAFASHNDFGTAVLLAAMEGAECRRLVLASSMVVYGDGHYRCDEHGMVVPAPRSDDDLHSGRFEARCPFDGGDVSWALVDEDAPLRPRSLYAAAKLAQEHYALAWSLATGGSVTALRYHNVYGDLMPRDTPYSGVAAMFRSSLEAGEPPRVYEDGRQTRDFVHVSDVAAANTLAVGRQLDGFHPLNICSGHPATIGEMAGHLARIRNGPGPVVTGQYRSGDVRHVVADPARAAAELGFVARVPLAEGLASFAWAPLRAAVPTVRPRV
jgi:dTDP-L-rhamnose 4-epimerase